MAIACTENTTWDPKTQQVTSSNDNAIQDVLDGDMDFNLAGDQAVTFKLPATLELRKAGGTADFANKKDFQLAMRAQI